MTIAKTSIGETARDSIAHRFCRLFKLLFVLLASCFLLSSCEEYEPFENNVFATSIPKDSQENNLSYGFDGFKYRYCFTTPDNQEISIEIIPWIVDLPNLMKYYIDYHFPQESQKSSYSNVYDTFKYNTFNWGFRTGIDCEIYKDTDLLDGWCYAFHTINGESVFIYTFARSGHCRPIKKLILDFNLKRLSKPAYSSILAKSDNMVADCIRKQHDNSTIYFTQPTDLSIQERVLPVGGTECGIMVIMKDNMRDKWGFRFSPNIHFDSHINLIAKLLNRNYLIYFKYPDGTIEGPKHIDIR